MVEANGGRERKRRTHVVELVAEDFGVLRGEVLLDELERAEELEALAAAELALLLVLDAREADVVQLAGFGGGGVCGGRPGVDLIIVVDGERRTRRSCLHRSRPGRRCPC